MTQGDDSRERLDEESRLAGEETRVADVAGTPTWPIVQPAPASAMPPPPVGLNWGRVAAQYDLDLRVLQHDGVVILTGDYFPEAGYAIDPVSGVNRFVDVGDIALRPCLFLGELAMRNFRVDIPIDTEGHPGGMPVIPPRPRGSVIGLFGDETNARRCRERILLSSLGSGITLQQGPLGWELHVGRSELPGRAATVMTAHGGAIIAAAGERVVDVGHGALATGRAMVGEQADSYRTGTGVTGDAQGPARQWGGSEELRPL